MASKKDPIHVFMLPFSAFGHMLPFFHLSVALARSGVRVSYLSTPRNIQRLPNPPFDLPRGLFQMVPLEFQEKPIEGVVLEGEATLDVQFDRLPYLKIAYDLLCHPFTELVDRSSPDFVLVDFVPHWACEVLHERGIPVGLFSIFNASCLAFFGSSDDLVGESKKRLRSSPQGLTSPPPWLGFPSRVAYRPHEAPWMLVGLYGENASGISDARRLSNVLSACDFVAIRSCHEFEGPYLEVVQKIMCKPVIPVGLLPPEKSMDQAKRSNGDNLLGWLDGRKEKSVVFVAFGTESKLSKEEVHEIARGLELSGLPFLWVPSKPFWVVKEEPTADEIMPQGFMERTRSVGKVHIGWVPQNDMLAHPSIGGCLFHCGWSSIIEMLRFGHRLVGMPLCNDQPLLAKLLVEKGLAVEVEIGEDDGKYRGERIAEALKAAMASEKGEALGARANEQARVVGDVELHRGYVTNFVEYLKCYHKQA